MARTLATQGGRLKLPILTLQKRMHEAGRIRIGVQVPTKSGKTRPDKLDTFRFSSSDRTKIEHLAQLFGGQPKPWRNGVLDQYDVVTDATTIDVIVPPTDMAFTQYLELWSGGGCQRRCDGARETLSDQPCMCDPDPEQRDCKPTTRLSLMVAQVQGMGLWRIETHGWYAASELAGSVELIQSAAGRGHLLPATLRLDKRTVTRPGQPRRDFAVPVLDVKLPLAQIAQATAGALGSGMAANGHSLPGASVAELEERTSSEPVPFTPVPASAPTRDRGTVADQVAKHQEQADAGPKRTKRSAAPVASTGRKPRTVEQARAEQPEPPPPDDDEQAKAAPSENTATAAQIRKLMATANDARLDDDGVHDVIRMVTSGRVESRKNISRSELDQALVACELIAGRFVDLNYDDGGALALYRTEDGVTIAWPTDANAVRGWIAERTKETSDA